MSDNYEKFMETLESPNTKKVAKSLSAIGEYDYTRCTIKSLENVVLEMKPNSLKSIMTICYMMLLYAKYLNNDSMCQSIQNIDKTELWERAKPNASKKFISNIDFEETHHDIGMFEELNGFYAQTLFKAVYEGIYCNDISVIKNLRGSDIHGNIVTLHNDDGFSYDLEISEGLANDLKELSKINECELRNRYKIYTVPTTGLYEDSCFKILIRNKFVDCSDAESYRFAYYRVLRKIAKEYLEYNLLPLQLFISGITYRIRLNLENNNITLEDAFSAQNRNKIVHDVIANELKRCNYSVTVNNYRQIVTGHVEVFTR